MKSMCARMTCLTTRCSLQLMLGITALGALFFALLAEYAFGIIPCDFCIYERWVFVAIFIVAVSDRIFFRRSSGALFGWLQVFILLIGCGITIFHVGMEIGLWKGPASCSSPLSVTQGPLTVEQVRAKLNMQPVVRCDRVNWSIFGISATIWLLSLFIGLLMYSLACVASWRCRQSNN